MAGTINTSFVERLNLDIRQRVAAIGRRVNTLCQGEAGLRDQLVLFQVYHNFVLPHASLRQALAEIVYYSVHLSIIVDLKGPAQGRSPGGA